MNHYALAGYGLDTGAPATPDTSLALFTNGQDATGGQAVSTAAGVGIGTPFGGANISGRISTTILAGIVIGLVVFYVKTRGIQL